MCDLTGCQPVFACFCVNRLTNIWFKWKETSKVMLGPLATISLIGLKGHRGQVMGQSHCRFDDPTTLAWQTEGWVLDTLAPSPLAWVIVHTKATIHYCRKIYPITYADLRLDCAALSSLLTSSCKHFNARRFMPQIISQWKKYECMRCDIEMACLCWIFETRLSK